MLSVLLTTYSIIILFCIICGIFYFKENPKERLNFWQTGIFLFACATWPLAFILWLFRRNRPLSVNDTNPNDILRYTVCAKINMGNYVDEWRVIRFDAAGNLMRIRLDYSKNQLDVRTKAGDAFFYSGRDEARNIVYFCYPILTDGEMPDLTKARKLEHDVFQNRVAPLVNPILLEIFNFKINPPQRL